MATAREKYYSLIKSINLVRIKQKRVDFLISVSQFFVLAGSAILFIIVLEMIFNFETKARLFIDCVLILLVVYLAIMKCGNTTLMLFRKHFPDDTKVASQMGNYYTIIGDRLANAVQVFSQKDENPQGYSVELIDSTLLEIDNQVKGINFKESVNLSRLFKYLKLFFIVILTNVLTFIFLPQDFNNAVTRFLHPWQEVIKYPNLKITVNPGNKQVLKNESVEIIAMVEGINIDDIMIHFKEFNSEFFLTQSLQPKQANLFKFLIEHIQDTTEYFFSYNDFSTEKYIISVFELPMVRNLQLKIFPPKYSQLRPSLLEENVGDIHCLKGTYVELSIAANKRLSKASIVFDKQKEKKLNISSFNAEAGFKVYENQSYFLKISDEQQLENREPILYHITTIEDLYPNAYFEYPGQDVDLTEDLLLPLKIIAEDDFGILSLRLSYKIEKADNMVIDTLQKFVNLPLKKDEDEKIFYNYTWDLTALNLFAGDVLRYYAEVFDNDVVSGPKCSKSQIYAARFASLEEIVADVNAEQEEAYESSEDVYEKSKELTENIDKLVEEIKQNDEMKCEKKKHLENIVEKQKNLENS